MPLKLVPQRTCIACRRVRPKWELVRIVRTPQGTVEIDPRGKESGRGAYVCKNQSCWEIGLRKDRKNRLARALKIELSPEERAQLLQYSKTFPANEGAFE
jgi:predicted RNA-binding protein YlxR (DUF448 family)